MEELQEAYPLSLEQTLEKIRAYRAAAQADIERQRTLLGQQYQLQINQAVADNNFELASALYQEAVRQDEALRQQQQFAAQMAMEGAKLAMQQSQYESDLALQYAKLAGSGSRSGGGGSGSGTSGTAPTDDLTNMFIAARDNGVFSPEEWLGNTNNLKKYGFNGYDAETITGKYNDWATKDNVSLNPRALESYILSGSASNATKNKTLWDYYDNGAITETDLRRYLGYLGTGA